MLVLLQYLDHTDYSSLEFYCFCMVTLKYPLLMIKPLLIRSGKQNHSKMLDTDKSTANTAIPATVSMTENLLNTHAILSLIFWYIFSFLTLFMNKYTLTTLRAEPFIFCKYHVVFFLYSLCDNSLLLVVLIEYLYFTFGVFTFQWLKCTLVITVSNLLLVSKLFLHALFLAFHFH